MTNYVDLYGRWHTKPVTDENPLPTNNAYIYSFYASMVGLPVKFSKELYYHLSSLNYKVANRHPGVVPPQGIVISHDEYVGLAGLHSHHASFIVEYGKNNNWQISDLPSFKSIQFRKLIINDVLSAYEDLANDPEPTRKAVVKYPALHPIAFYHRPDQQYFYYRCAGKSPGIIRTIYFILATLFAIARTDKTSPMLGFKFLKLKQLGPTLFEKGLIKLFNTYGKWTEVCQNYFPKDHPILEKVLNLYGESMYSGGGI